MSITDIISNAFTAKRWRVKKYVYVKAKYRRDARGRFTGGIARKAYSYSIPDKSRPMVTNMQLMAENITASNVLLAKLRGKALVAEQEHGQARPA